MDGQTVAIHEGGERSDAMSEKSGYGGQIFILIIAIVLIASLSRVKSSAPTQTGPAQTEQISRVDHVVRPQQ
jgi:hypothetical protein